MSEGDSDSSFLAAGVRHFPDAHAATTAFRRLITEKVELILTSSRPDVWKPKDEVKPTKAESNGLWVGAGGPMALERIPGRAPVIDVGIWWKSSHFKEPRTAAAVVYAAKDAIGGQLAGRDAAGVRFVRSGKVDIFGIPLADDIADVEDALRRVVEAASNAVANAIAAAKASSPTIPQENK